jgi:hypothetical protein
MELDLKNGGMVSFYSMRIYKNIHGRRSAGGPGSSKHQPITTNSIPNDDLVDLI